MSLILALTWYFTQDNFALANGISSTGAALGMVFLPPLTERMMDAYGWRGAILIHSGLSFHSAICGMLIRPHQQQYKSVPAEC